MKWIQHFTLSLFVTVSLVACSVPAVQQDVTTWQEQYDLGLKYLAESNFSEAVVAFTAAIAIDPKQAEAYLALADSYIGTGDVDSARKILEQGLSTSEDKDVLMEKLRQLTAESETGKASENENAPEGDNEAGSERVVPATAEMTEESGVEDREQETVNIAQSDSVSIPAENVVGNGLVLTDIYREEDDFNGQHYIGASATIAGPDSIVGYVVLNSQEQYLTGEDISRDFEVMRSTNYVEGRDVFFNGPEDIMSAQDSYVLVIGLDASGSIVGWAAIPINSI